MKFNNKTKAKLILVDDLTPFGDNYVAFSEAEVKYRNTVKKKAVAAITAIIGKIIFFILICRLF